MQALSIGNTTVTTNYTQQKAVTPTHHHGGADRRQVRESLACLGRVHAKERIPPEDVGPAVRLDALDRPEAHRLQLPVHVGAKVDAFERVDGSDGTLAVHEQSLVGQLGPDAAGDEKNR